MGAINRDFDRLQPRQGLAHSRDSGRSSAMDLIFRRNRPRDVDRFSHASFIQCLYEQCTAPGKILLLLVMMFLVAVAPARSNEIRYGTRSSSETRRMELNPYDHVKRTYIYGGYNLHFTNNSSLYSTEKLNNIEFHNNWFAGAGLRWTAGIRTELAFEQFKNEWQEIGTTHGYFGFFNVVFDAMVDGRYKSNVTNPFMPFIGFGAGAGIYEFGNDTMVSARRISGAYNLIAGISIDLNRTVALVISYRYTRVLSRSDFEWQTIDGYDPLLDIDGEPVQDMDGNTVWDYNSPIITNHDFQGFRPTSHNIGLSLRMSF